jgi:hypothetical protein
MFKIAVTAGFIFVIPQVAKLWVNSELPVMAAAIWNTCIMVVSGATKYRTAKAVIIDSHPHQTGIGNQSASFVLPIPVKIGIRTSMAICGNIWSNTATPVWMSTMFNESDIIFSLPFWVF